MARDTPSPSAETSTEPAVDTDVAGLSYEASRDELIDIVGRLEGGQVSLEESMRLWRRGEALAQHCETWLTRAEATLGGTGTTGSGALDD